jgi:hypothetical protein
MSLERINVADRPCLPALFVGVRTKDDYIPKGETEPISLHSVTVRLGDSILGTLSVDADLAAALHKACPAIQGRRLEIAGVKTLVPKVESRDGVTSAVIGQKGDQYYSMKASTGLFGSAPTAPITLRFLPEEEKNAASGLRALPKTLVEGI